MILTTLCYIENEDSFLMLHRTKKEKDMNKDKWIGVGGKLEESESPDDCLLREVREETSLCLRSFRMRGILTFVSDEWETEYIFLYTSDQYEGEIGSCAEGDLRWVKKEEIEKLNLWEGDKIFLRLLREEHPFFSLKLCYSGDVLKEAVLDGQVLISEVSEEK